MRSQFEEQKQKNKEWGLVLAKDIKVQNKYNEIKFKGKINIGSAFNGHSQAYYNGQEEGLNFGINRVENKRKQQSLLET